MKEHKFISSSRATGAPSVLPLYKEAALAKERRAKSSLTLASSVVFVVLSTVIFVFFFVSIYWGTTFLQSHVEEENSLLRGLPGTRNIIRKWSRENLRGFDITELGNPPGKHNHHNDDPTIADEFAKLKRQARIELAEGNDASVFTEEAVAQEGEEEEVAVEEGEEVMLEEGQVLEEGEGVEVAVEEGEEVAIEEGQVVEEGEEVVEGEETEAVEEAEAEEQAEPDAETIEEEGVQAEESEGEIEFDAEVEAEET